MFSLTSGASYRLVTVADGRLFAHRWPYALMQDAMTVVVDRLLDERGHVALVHRHDGAVGILKCFRWPPTAKAIREIFLRQLAASSAAADANPQWVGAVVVEDEPQALAALDIFRFGELAILADLVKERRPRWQHIIRLAQTLDRLQGHGLAHLDVKPDNIVATRDPGLVQLVDFGHCRALDPMLARAEEAWWLLEPYGPTPPYAAAEDDGVLAGLQPLDVRRREIHQVGVTAAQLALGEPDPYVAAAAVRAAVARGDCSALSEIARWFAPSPDARMDAADELWMVGGSLPPDEHPGVYVVIPTADRVPMHVLTLCPLLPFVADYADEAVATTAYLSHFPASFWLRDAVPTPELTRVIARSLAPYAVTASLIEASALWRGKPLSPRARTSVESTVTRLRPHAPELAEYLATARTRRAPAEFAAEAAAIAALELQPITHDGKVRRIRDTSDELIRSARPGLGAHYLVEHIRGLALLLSIAVRVEANDKYSIVNSEISGGGIYGADVFPFKTLKMLLLAPGLTSAYFATMPWPVLEVIIERAMQHGRCKPSTSSERVTVLASMVLASPSNPEVRKVVSSLLLSDASSVQRGDHFIATATAERLAEMLLFGEEGPSRKSEEWRREAEQVRRRFSSDHLRDSAP